MSVYYRQVLDQRTGQTYWVRDEPNRVDGVKIFGIVLSFLGMVVAPVIGVLVTNLTANSRAAEPSKVVQTPIRPSDPCDGALSDWQSASATNTRAAYREYLLKHPGCSFSNLAQEHIKLLDQQEQLRIEAERAKAKADLRRQQADMARRIAAAEAQAEADLRRQQAAMNAERQRLEQEIARQRATAEAEARKLQDQYLSGQQYVISHGWIGVTIQSVTKDIADAVGMTEPVGAIVTSVQSGSPAESAGIGEGDVIWAINGRKMSSAEDLSLQLKSLPPGGAAILDIIRDGCSTRTIVTLGQLAMR